MPMAGPMSEQLTLDSVPRKPQAHALHPFDDAKASERFQAFHEENPEIYGELVNLARSARARGRARLGIGHLFEVIRWQRMMRTNDPNGGDLKLNNNYRSRYARLLMEREPDLADLFETRELKTE